MIILEQKRFKQIYFEEFPPVNPFKPARAVSEMEIIKDLETGILYCVAGKGNGGLTMTPLLGTDGKPLIDKSE